MLSEKEKPLCSRQLFTIAASRIEARHNRIIGIVLRGLLDDRHRLVAFLVIGERQRRSLRKQSGKRKHQLTLAVTGITLQQCDLAEGNIGMPITMTTPLITP